MRTTLFALLGATLLTACANQSTEGVNVASATSATIVWDFEGGPTCGGQSFDKVMPFKHQSPDSNGGIQGCLGLNEDGQALLVDYYDGGRTSRTTFTKVDGRWKGRFPYRPATKFRDWDLDITITDVPAKDGCWRPTENTVRWSGPGTNYASRGARLAPQSCS